MNDKYVLVTGQIARGAVGRIAEKIRAKNPEMILEVKPLRGTVAALMTTEFIARELEREEQQENNGDTLIVIPGLCQGPLEPITQATGCRVKRGPKDIKDLPAFFNTGESAPSEYAASPMRIMAEIIDAPLLSEKQILERARYYRENGADIIDLGGDVHRPFPRLKEAIQLLKSEGFMVSVDSHQKEDILAAKQAGADIILSFTSHNLELAKDFPGQAVLIPDDGEDLISLYRNMEKLTEWQVSCLVDPILPPLTMGLAEGISRYVRVRKDFPDCELFMGLGNVTELTDADSTGITALLVGIAGELQINTILTTEASHRALGAVREVSLARRLIQQALLEHRVPKHMDESLLTIKDSSGNSFAENDLWEMHGIIRDKNYRIFVADQIYIFNANTFLKGTSAEDLFSRLDVRDAKHAFYLGKELGKAELALKLGKKYVQDSPLNWGYFNQKD